MVHRAQLRVTLPFPQQDDDEMSLFFRPVRLRTVSLGAGVMWIPSADRSVLPNASTCCTSFQ